MILDGTAAQNCEKPSVGYREAKKKNFQVVHNAGKMEVTAYHCFVEYTRTATYCWGWGSWTSSPQPIATKKMVQLSSSECVKAVQDKQIEFEGHKFQAGLYDRRMRHERLLHGQRDQFGWCQGDAFVAEGFQWYKTLDDISLTLSMGFMKGVIDLAKNRIVFANGKVANYDDGYHHSQVGTLVWPTDGNQIHACDTGFYEIYSGSLTYREPYRADFLPIAMIEDESSDQHAGFAVKGKKIRQ